jgi:hypothetical protein
MGADAEIALDGKLVQIDEMLLAAGGADDVLEVAHEFPG